MHDSIDSQDEISGARWVLLSMIVVSRNAILSVVLVVSWGRKDYRKQGGF